MHFSDESSFFFFLVVIAHFHFPSVFVVSIDVLHPAPVLGIVSSKYHQEFNYTLIQNVKL